MYRFGVLIILLMIILSPCAYSRTITDMAGRKVDIPDRIEKAIGLSPPATYLIYAIDPALLAGLNLPLWEHEKIYTADRLKKLPVVGGMVGEGRNLNVEVLLGIKPDIVILWQLNRDDINAINKKYEQILKPLGIPIVYVRINSISDYPAAFRFVGDVLGRKERAAALERYAVGAMRKVSRSLSGLPPGKRVSVYYAEGLDGLSTEGEESLHTRLIPLSGGRNVCRMKETSLMGLEKISMEQLLMYDPDAILVMEKPCYERVMKDARWKHLRAVRGKRVYLIPNAPFNWFDRPPSYMQFLGIQWLAGLLHPGLYQVDMVRETKTFYRLFLGRDLTDREARQVLQQ
ncbi:MAG TPA: ABC transporter substrate-binding protein [Geobacteraceae bacterium]|nr:ABC transporter substrate-binding protein [Geobacteraceae bacterium]